MGDLGASSLFPRLHAQRGQQELTSLSVHGGKLRQERPLSFAKKALGGRREEKQEPYLILAWALSGLSLPPTALPKPHLM